MKKFTIYSKGYCPFCKRAIQLAEKTGAEVEVIDVVGDEDTYTKIKKQTGQQTVPQVFIGDEFIGGFDELSALKTSGELENRLKA